MKLFAGEYFFAGRKIRELFNILAEAVPGADYGAIGGRWRREKKVCGWWCPCSSGRAAGVLSTILARVLDADWGRILGKYRKMHIPDDPLYYEKFYFTAPGDLGFLNFDTQYARDWRTDLLGPVVSGGVRGFTAMQGSATDFFIRPSIGWHPA